MVTKRQIWLFFQSLNALSMIVSGLAMLAAQIRGENAKALFYAASLGWSTGWFLVMMKVRDRWLR